jgi:glutaminyl-tRNA synthetase
MSKRKLLELVKNGYVSGWDDPRMPTICGIRRRGYTPESIRMFAEKVGVAKRDNVIDLSLLEWCLREDLNKRANRYMAVLNPLKVVITNYPDNETETLKAINNPEDESAGTHEVPFSKIIYMEKDDFMENPPKKYFRLSPGNEVRLRYAYFIKCTEAVKDENGEIIEIHCTYDPASRGGNSPDGRKVQGTVHWVSAQHAAQAEVRLFDRLFTEPFMDNIPEDKDYKDFLNPDSLKKVTAFIEPVLKNLEILDKVQFERVGYFCVDKDSTAEKPVFNRTATLKDTWSKISSRSLKSK